MREKDFEDILVKYPELIEDDLELLGRQITVHNRRIDLLFKDTHYRRLVIELKIGPIKDQHIGQILSYEGMLLSDDNPTLRVMLVGNRVPPNIRKSLDHHGIAWKEISNNTLKEFIEKKQDNEFIRLFQNYNDISIPKDKTNNLAPPISDKETIIDNNNLSKYLELKKCKPDINNLIIEIDRFMIKLGDNIKSEFAKSRNPNKTPRDVHYRLFSNKDKKGHNIVYVRPQMEKILFEIPINIDVIENHLKNTLDIKDKTDNFKTNYIVFYLSGKNKLKATKQLLEFVYKYRCS